MGEDSLRKAGFGDDDFDVVYHCRRKTSASDTKAACMRFLAMKGNEGPGIDLILFCGGDGTARDIYETVGTKIPMLGIPAGVKMHSGVFCVNVHSVVGILLDFINDRLTTNDVEVIDLDEARYRKGEWKLKLFGIARTPFESNYIQGGKMLIEEVSEEEVKQEIAAHVVELMDKQPDALFVLGAGSTLETIGKRLGIDKTLLGIDAVFKKELIAKDMDERTLLKLLTKYKSARVVLSPIGAQGFILGRGNLQLSDDVIRKIGIENMIIVSTPSKLLHTPILRVDTGDEALDKEIKSKYIYVINGYHSVCLRTIE
jgi:predicted polyphosphate/ATP-dependent NAD kinase